MPRMSNSSIFLFIFLLNLDWIFTMNPNTGQRGGGNINHQSENQHPNLNFFRSFTDAEGYVNYFGHEFTGY